MAFWRQSVFQTVLSILLVLAALSAARPANAAQWIEEARYADFHVVLQEHAPPIQKTAAEQFQRYWEEATGHAPSRAAQPKDGKVNVWVGGGPPGLAPLKEREALGADGVLLRTARKRDKRKLPYSEDTEHLVLTGGPRRGALYAVFQFFEDYLGLRWLTPGFTHIPAPPASLPHIDFRHAPPFAYRDVSYKAFHEHPEFAAAHRLNGFWSPQPPAWGGNISYALEDVGFGHTFYYYVYPGAYFYEHPEFFSEIEGKRIGHPTQLCLTNPDVLAITIAGVREVLREAAPNERIVSISQMDWDNWCTCANCSALDEHEESHSGAIIHFVNKVAGAIEAEFPDAFIDTFAYRYSRKPPKHVRPRDNVIVRLTSMGVDFSQPINTRSNAANQAFKRDLRGWSRIAKNLYVWDYTQNWYAFQAPHPNIHVYQPNAALFAKYGVQGVFEQASPLSPHSDFEHLKGYILAHVLWDPKADWKALHDEFIALYYQEAAPYIHAYLDLVTKRVRNPEVFLSMYMPAYWMDHDLVVQAQEIFARAFSAVENDATRYRLENAYIAVQYAALLCGPKITFDGETYFIDRPPSATLQEFTAMLQARGVTHLADEPLQLFEERYHGATPPRREEIPIEKIENDHLLLWITPSQSGAIIRLRDKRNKIDLLDGFRFMGEDIGKWTEWLVFDETSIRLTEEYDVTEKGPRRLHLERKYEAGLLLRKRITLDDEAPRIDIELDLHNWRDEPFGPINTSRIDFNLPNAHRAQLWLERNGQWTLFPLQHDPDGPPRQTTLPAEGLTRWALYLPKQRLSLIHAFHAKSWYQPFLYYSPDTGTLSIEVDLGVWTLHPGETRTFRFSLDIKKGRPGALKNEK